MFRSLIRKTMKVYIDDLLTKSLQTQDHMSNLKKTSEVLRMYNMKLNLKKYAFGVSSGKFLSFMVTRQGIEANPEKI